MIFKEIFKSVSKKEWQFIAFFSLLLVLITSIPLIYGWLKTPPGKIFTAMHFASADDWFVYYSFINQGKDGLWLFKDLFSSVEHLAVIRPEWLVVGLLARLFDFSAPVAFHLARILLIPVFIFVCYLIIAYFFTDKLKRKLALIFLGLSSGVGTLLIYRLALYPSNYVNGNFSWPMDLWVPDINTFFTLFASPHFIAASILVFLIFLSTILFSDEGNYFYSLVAGLSGLLLFIIHPFQVLKVYAIIGVFFLILFIRNRRIIWNYVWHGFIFFILSLPSVLYYLWLINVDWLTVQRAAQNINPTTPIYVTIFSFGGLFFGAVLGIYYLLENNRFKQNKYLFLAVWAVIQFILLYAPVNYQRRLALGIHLPLALLTAIFIFYFYEINKVWVKKNATAVVVFFILIFLPSNLFVLATDIMVYSQEREASYLDLDTYNAFIWLKENSEPSSIIFSTVRTGNVLPAYALRTSYVGHAVETPFFNQRKIEPDWFFSQGHEMELEHQFLSERNISYVFFGPRESELGNFHPESKNYLAPVYTSPKAKIFKVLPR